MVCWPKLLLARLLAEWMMPDGVHKWNTDWTVFFLNRPADEVGEWKWWNSSACLLGFSADSHP